MGVRITRISARDNPLLVRLRKLARHPSAYRKEGIVLLEGEHLCEAWQRRAAGPPQQALVAESAWESGAVAALAGGATSVAIVADDAMAGLGTLETPSAISFVIALPPAAAIEPRVASVVLDRIQDAGNVGSILRSASAFGFGQVIALVGTASLWSPKVLRAGMGAHFGLRLVEGVEAASLDAAALPLVATSSHAAPELHATALPWPCAWVLGNEGEGVAPALLERCAVRVRIPQPGGEESLNVAAAAAVCLYESMRRAR